MKVKEFMENMNKLIKKYPEIEEHEAITAIDDEGNGFNYIIHYPTIGKCDGEDFEEYPETEDLSETDSVCLN